MEPFTTLTGLVAPLDRVNVNTDEIIPARFTKTTRRTGFEKALFANWRYLDPAAQQPNPDFVLNQPRYQGATILLTDDNFGCGSSREHAPWAIEDYGFRVVIAPSFADIFYNNCRNSGVLAIVTSQQNVEAIAAKAEQHPGYQLSVDLESSTIHDDSGLSFTFDIDPFTRRCFLEGLDDIGLTLRHENAIRTFEQTHSSS